MLRSGPDLRSHASDRQSELFLCVADRLADRLRDYANPDLSAAQRRFLMMRLQELRPSAVFPTLAAEQLAVRYVDAAGTSLTGHGLIDSGLPKVWQLVTPRSRTVLLWNQSTVVARADRILASQPLPSEIVVKLLPPTARLAQEDIFLSLRAGKSLPGWRLTLALRDRAFFTDASQARITSYFWTGTLGVASIAALVLVIGRTIRNQTRLTRLKNDLVATITHELKTPLSSMRLLVDMLLNDDKFDQGQVREYLLLIAKENKRLSRLIDNFLAFSRIERNKYRFEFASTTPTRIIQATVSAMPEQFHAAECDFETRVEPSLPPVQADEDALVTVLLNLLDNAYKYSGDHKQVMLSAFATDESVCFRVDDNGIGIAPREAKKIFKRFYQARQQITRGGGGCGLGLSIVQYIVEAHGGSVQVTSRREGGSSFTVRLPRVAKLKAAESTS